MQAPSQSFKYRPPRRDWHLGRFTQAVKGKADLSGPEAKAGGAGGWGTGGKEASGELAALKVELCALPLSQFRYSPSKSNLTS